MKNIIFGIDNTSSSPTDNWNNNCLALDEGPTDGINDNTGAAEEKHDSGDESYLLVKKPQRFANVRWR